ncbi:MAG TPA: UDP-N-acetylmuramoyl-L-alanine--D-glutamate ligase [Candidatus Saccharimonadales bacterium]|nr:UDP-N-acetylmuramoyl-L-alanine--D-glutamate ligase [Candidatus Saccharimonadales bacterium]
MNVAIVGYGAVEGKSALAYWQAQGAEVTVCDKNEHVVVPPGVPTQLGAGYLHDLGRFDLIVRNAGLHPKIILAENPRVEGKITTIVDEFLRVCPTKNTIGVTGTKGKGTTSTLIVKMLEAAGKQVFLGGNYGISPFDFLDKLTPDSWVVLELSSFMLYDIKHSPHIGVVLMVQPEHLDWHGSEEDYYNSKAHMFAYQNDHDIAIYYADNNTSHRLASTSPGEKIAFYDEPGAYIYDGNVMIDQTVLCKTSELKLLGKHNWQNVCAAATAVWQATQAPDAIRKVLTTFSGLPHRLEFVREVDGVGYYNDSFASDPYATQAAIQAIPGMKVLIVGGFDRMLPLEHFVETVKENQKDIRTIILIGDSAKRVASELHDSGLDNFKLSPATTMQTVVAEAHAHAEKGDSVLLSPGFASFDMFKNFEDRGQQFKECVHHL